MTTVTCYDNNSHILRQQLHITTTVTYYQILIKWISQHFKEYTSFVFRTAPRFNCLVNILLLTLVSEEWHPSSLPMIYWCDWSSSSRDVITRPPVREVISCLFITGSSYQYNNNIKKHNASPPPSQQKKWLSLGVQNIIPAVFLEGL